MNRTDIRQTLDEESIRLTKSLGQNLLHDQNVLRRIVKAADIQMDDEVLEVGPGLGALTEFLLPKAKNLLAIEKDRRLVEHLRHRFEDISHFQLLHHDALEHFKNQDTDWTDWKFVSNLPYSVASPLLVDLALMPRGPRQLVVTLQHEVARRICATPGTKEYGRLTLLVQFNYVPDSMFKISPHCFFPEPRVDSACLSLCRRNKPILPNSLQGTYTTLIKRAFSQRRKMMRKNLRGNWPDKQIDEAIATVGLDEKIRAERVTLEQFARLTELLNESA
ncbi:MAG: 16S rRNA (adenine(1518)-N(6)/adenine(1519)-N(6))-dimethyltransferase RsmA [Verrucomicrobiota bacterium]|jgi:16S rRNA (adenine1518-N6/adenine1519-N6)-dimethyltransferase|nr:16S rRNA (adenine(1518)-N(6)/adenine(1519)-N(6))-dimethyltransferase RsmA [Verrucomicrobiota bacterium]